MQEVTRNSYSLYQRKTGSRTIWYARFWDDDTQTYGSGRSTGQTTRPAAHRIVQKWLAEGMPEVRRNISKVSQDRIVNVIAKYLEETEVIRKGEKHEPAELIKLFYAQVTNRQMSSGETFVDYLYRFWAWDGKYVQGRLARKKTIGKRHVEDCLSRIKIHVAPYFKDTLLCDVTTNSLEQFMLSIPRRDENSENGYAMTTINIIMKVIKVALKDATRLGLIPKNPADGIELLANDARERGILTLHEVEDLFQIDWMDERGKIASILAAVSGMRLSEVIALQREDIDAEHNVIFVRHGYSPKEGGLKSPKNGKQRIVYTDASIIQMLIGLYEKNPHAGTFVFWGLETDKPIRIESIAKYLERALDTLFGEKAAAGLTGDSKREALTGREQEKRKLQLGEGVRKERNLSFHGFRHFFNSTIRGTVSDDILRLQTGHLDAKMTDAYDHITDERGEQLRKAIQTKILPHVAVESTTPPQAAGYVVVPEKLHSGVHTLFSPQGAGYAPLRPQSNEKVQPKNPVYMPLENPSFVVVGSKLAKEIIAGRYPPATGHQSCFY